MKVSLAHLLWFAMKLCAKAMAPCRLALDMLYALYTPQFSTCTRGKAEVPELPGPRISQVTCSKLCCLQLAASRVARCKEHMRFLQQRTAAQGLTQQWMVAKST